MIDIDFQSRFERLKETPPLLVGPYRGPDFVGTLDRLSRNFLLPKREMKKKVVKKEIPKRGIKYKRGIRPLSELWKVFADLAS